MAKSAKSVKPFLHRERPSLKIVAFKLAILKIQKLLTNFSLDQN
jgi:hypothetical protein